MVFQTLKMILLKNRQTLADIHQSIQRTFFAVVGHEAAALALIGRCKHEDVDL